MKNLIRKLWRHNEKFSAIIPFAVLAAILLSGQLIRTATADVSRKFYQTSPNPSPTFTPSPVGPTNTPPPPTSTDTPTPTALPPTSTDTPTPTALPPTSTDTPTPTALPPTSTDTPTPTALPPTSTDTATPTALPPTSTDTATPTQLPPTATDTATPLPPTPTETPDPHGNKVTGGGWIDSPPGAYALDPEAVGKASFGFVTNHKNGANAPIGNTTFHLKSADFKFKSESYQWLTVNHNDNTAIYRGRGTFKIGAHVNGVPSNFMVWVGDDPDTFRIKIWLVPGLTLYDNGFDQSIVGGNITVHKGKK